MIHSETKFPNPGSIAEHDGQRCRVMQLLPGNRVMLSIIDAGRFCRADIADLTDPKAVENAALAALVNPGEVEKQRALWIARHLRDANEVRIGELETAMWHGAREGRVPVCHERRQLTALLRKLGWTYNRPSQLYVRAAMAKAA